MSATDADRFIRRPTLVSSVVAIVAGSIAIGLIAETTGQRRILVATVLGAVAFGVGGRLLRRDHGVAGVALLVSGGGLVVAAIAYTAIRPPQLVDRFELLPGLVGLWILAAALVPIRHGWSRRCIDAGTGLLFVGVLTSGVVRGAATTALLGAAVATILAWDAAENAVSLGGQVGARSIGSTVRAELVHVGASGTVATGAIIAALGISNLGVDGLPLAALLALLVAILVLALAAHR